MVPDSTRPGMQTPVNAALQGQSYVHVNDLSGVSSNMVQSSSGTQALLTNSNSSSISPDAHFRAEYKLLTDFLISVPKVSDTLSFLCLIEFYHFRSSKKKSETLSRTPSAPSLSRTYKDSYKTTKQLYRISAVTKVLPYPASSETSPRTTSVDSPSMESLRTPAITDYQRSVLLPATIWTQMRWVHTTSCQISSGRFLRLRKTQTWMLPKVCLSTTLQMMHSS